MRLASLAFAVLASALPATTLADPTGKYEVRGTNGDGEGEYAGTVSVTRNGDTYKVVWKIGDTRFIGTGLGARVIDGRFETGPASKEDTALSIVYNSGSAVGNAFYFEQPDGTWKGTWAYSDSTSVATESWNPSEAKATEPGSAVVTEKKVLPARVLSAPKPAIASPNPN